MGKPPARMLHLVADHEASTPPSLARIGSVSDHDAPGAIVALGSSAVTRGGGFSPRPRAGRGAAPDEMARQNGEPQNGVLGRAAPAPRYSDDGSRNRPLGSRD